MEIILKDLKKHYGIKTIENITPVMGGLMNLKWKITTEIGYLLVKQYSMERFRRDQLDKIESALQRQIIVHNAGVKCPKLYTVNNVVIRWVDDVTAYMVMDFCEGKTENYETATLPQLYSLGKESATMHSKGLAHEDMQAANILFHRDSLSAIVDFDRNFWGEPYHDIGRMLLSFTLNNDVMDMEKVRAFAEGYSLNLRDIPEIMRITHRIEEPWWIPVEHEGEVPKRFRYEIMWVAEHMDELELFFG
jgi:Mn2+-dependent serine/threonine protein kinase